MNNLYCTLKKILLLFVLIFSSFSLASQDKNLSNDQLKSLKDEVSQLVEFLEYSLNILGDDNTPASQKEIIIYESYSKIFADDNVQVEDDLDDKRDVVINKDVQAYLKDIDFFFKGVSFDFNIEKIEPQFKENNQLYFLITMNRKIEGITVKDDTLKNNLLRYIEVNYDNVENDLRIASIYSTKLNENEEYMYWWNNMDNAWKDYLASDVKIFDTLLLKDVLGFNDSAIIVYKYYAYQEIDSVITYGDTVITLYDPPSDTIVRKDTVLFHTDILFNKIRSITRKTQINIEENYTISNLDPLDKLKKLEILNISKTTIHDLTPVRNLSKLEFLDCSESDVYDISALKYCENLRDLKLNSTAVNDISVVAGFDNLENLYIQDTRVFDLSPVKNCFALKDLRISGSQIDNLLPVSELSELTILDCSRTKIRTLQSLSNLNKLTRLYCSNTIIHDIRYLSGLSQLQTLNLDNTKVSSLKALNAHKNLEKIYCDNAMITSKVANEFMAENPGVLVIYESSTLQFWWDQLSIDWQLKFSEYFDEDLIPTKEQLHQILNITEINISNNGRISSIDPLNKLEKLEKLDISFTLIDDLEPINDHVDLRYLNAGNSRIKSLAALKDLINLQYLNVANTMVNDLSPLFDLPHLQEINLDNTRISSLSPLKNDVNISIIHCDNAGVSLSDALELYKDLPESLIIYQTEDLQKWWIGIPIAWQDVFRDIIGFQGDPDKYQLHRITNIIELDLNDNKNIRTLFPVYPLQRLQALKLSGTGISDLDPVKVLKFLVYLDISNNPITNLEPLESNYSIIYLDIRNNPIEDFSFISRLHYLEYLYCSGTNIKDLRFAGSLSNLKKLSFYNTRIKNLKEIEGLHNLEKIECYNTKLSARKVQKFKENHPGCELVFY